MTLHHHVPRGWREALTAALLRTLLRTTLKPVFSPRVPLARQRAWLEGLSRLSLPPFGARMETGAVGAAAGEGPPPRPVEWWTAAEGATRPGTLLYLHGGAYCLGSPRTHRSLTGRLARATGLAVCSLDYRLAPEHPWPAALEDTLAAVRWLRAHRPGPVVIGGDSAGGGLALAAALALRDAREAGPDALLLLSPWVEADFDRVPPEPPGEAMLSRAWGEACARHVLAGADPRALSPLHAPLQGLPPVIIEAGTDELLHDQAVALHEALERAGVPVTTHITRGRWHVFPLHAGTLPSADDAVRRLADFTLGVLDAAEGRPAARPTEVREVVMLGAGMSGLCLAIRLKQAGQHDFVVLEKSTGLGGTWWDNRYPGAHVDVPAPLYSFSFAPNPRWRQRFAAAPEIQAYMQDCAFRFRVRPHMRLGTAVTAAVYDESRGRWTIDTADGRRYDARFFVCSTGPLSQVRWPDLPGLETFAGVRLHSARWDATVPLAGRRIGVIGTGSTASQLVPPLAAQAAHLTVFQRTANWVLPRMDRRYTALDRLLARLPAWSAPVRRAWRALLEWGRRSFDEGTLARRGMLRTAELHRRRGVPDPALRQRLVPPYPLGCKRIIYSNDYYPALSRPNVALVTERIEASTTRGVRTADGQEHALDVLVCATGFDTTHMLKDVALVGRGGQSLSQAWADGPEAYRGVTVPGFPNFFLTLGPNTGTGHTSTLLYIEPQVDFILRAMARVRQQQAVSIEVRDDVHREHNAALQRRLDGSVWSTCRSWYRTDAGKIVALWPGFTREYEAGLQKTDWAAFTLHRAGGPPA